MWEERKFHYCLENQLFSGLSRPMFITLQVACISSMNTRFSIAVVVNCWTIFCQSTDTRCRYIHIIGVSLTTRCLIAGFSAFLHILGSRIANYCSITSSKSIAVAAAELSLPRPFVYSWSMVRQPSKWMQAFFLRWVNHWVSVSGSSWHRRGESLYTSLRPQSS